MQASPSSEVASGPHKVIFTQIGLHPASLSITDAAGQTSSYSMDIEVKPSTKDLS
ncbi:MAG: hypothetical protein R3B47_08980 [Bacteroidia bacterium]